MLVTHPASSRLFLDESATVRSRRTAPSVADGVQGSSLPLSSSADVEQ